MSVAEISSKISIITPLYNNFEFLSETIESVIFQKGNFSIEYIIVDNCSTDSSLDIASKYKKLVEENTWLIKCKEVRISIISEPDQGMYDAINKGFSKATGDFFAYINSDDIYLPGAFEVVTELFKKYPDVDWLKGITSYINDKSIIYKRGNANLYYTNWIKNGVYGTLLYFIQQDSVFWRSELWEKTGKIDSRLKLAGDFSLWINFAQKSDLYTFNVDVSCFRKVDRQLSEDIDKYYNEIATIKYQKISKFEKFKLRVYLYVSKKVKVNNILSTLYRILFPTHEYRYIKIGSNKNTLIKQKSLIIDK